jgi:hypothetical protein
MATPFYPLKVSRYPQFKIPIIDDREDSISYGSYTTKWIDGDTDDTDDTGTLYQFILIEKV